MVRRILLTAAVGILVVPAALQAQQGVVQATAVVAEHIAVTGSGGLEFGELTRGVDAVISATAGAVRTLEYNLDVDVAFTSTNQLESGDGDVLPITYYCAHRTGAGAWQGEENECSNGFDLMVGPATTTTTLGFGARILSTHIDAARAGVYTGTLNIWVTAR
jgi:hypothetical protein